MFVVNELSGDCYQESLTLKLEQFDAWLQNYTESRHTRRVYLSQVRKFLSFLQTYYGISTMQGLISLEENGQKLGVMRRYRTILKNELCQSASSINNALFSVDRFMDCLGLPRILLPRELRSKHTSKILNSEEQQRFLSSVAKQRHVRDRVIALLLFHSDLRISECASLDVSNFCIDGEDTFRVITVNGGIVERPIKHAELTKMLKRWLEIRSALPNANANAGAIWINRDGRRLTVSGIDYVLRRIGWGAGLVLSAESLRQTSICNSQSNSIKTQVGETPIMPAEPTTPFVMTPTGIQSGLSV